MLAPVSNSPVVVHFWTVMWYIALIPYMEASLKIMATFVDSQSELGDIKSEYWSKRLSKSSLPAALCTGSALSVWLSCVSLIVSIPSFITTSCDLEELDRVFDFFGKVYFSLKMFNHMNS